VDEALPQIEIRWPDTVPLDVVLSTRPVVERVPELVGEGATDWLGARAIAIDGEDRRRFICDLELGTGAGSRTLFRKSAIVSFGEPRSLPTGWLVPVEWQAATLVPLFPVFAGYVEVGEDALSIHGRYAPPGGTIGRALDAAVLNMAARATASWFLRRLAAALNEA
jgi:hypothetical protein